MMNRTLIAAALSMACAGAFAQATTPATAATATTAMTTTQRDVSQQTRIENGLKNGSLSTKEASSLEKKEAHVDRLQSRDLKDGRLSAGERAQLQATQNKVSRDIAVARHNDVTGNPQSTSSRRMQADVARNVHQEARIGAGIRQGSLTNHEVASLERGQAHTDRLEAAAGANGHVAAAEQRGIQRAEGRQSHRIHHDKTDARLRG